MLDSGRQFAQVCAQVLPAREPVYEFGSYLVPDMAIDADLRPLFGGQRFVGADIRPGPGVDQVLDLQEPHQIGLGVEPVVAPRPLGRAEQPEIVVVPQRPPGEPGALRDLPDPPGASHPPSLEPAPGGVRPPIQRCPSHPRLLPKPVISAANAKLGRDRSTG